MPAINPHNLADPNTYASRHLVPSKVKRKLTTILCADVQGYSTLMGSDEADTLARLQRYRAIMAELFERHDGRKVNTWGDSVIAEFPSVVEAVRCAVEIQDAVGAENRDLPTEKQMLFRIGINLGDVMQDGSDLYGDGVNVAARLESLADAGGIMVSETVYDLTHRQLSFAYDYAGEQQVKGQDQPIAGYRVRMPDSNSAPRGDSLLDPTPSYQEPSNGEPQQAAAMSAPVQPRRERHAADTPRRFRSGPLGRVQDWYFRQTRAVRVPVAMISLFFIINLFTTGLDPAWFIYPSMPFVAFLVARYLAGTLKSEK